MFRTFRLLFLSIFLCGLLGCENHDKVRDKKILSIGSLDTIINIDPQVASSVNEVKFLSAIFEGLVVPEPGTYRPLPGVAEKWTVSEDGKVYEFYLRKNARWSNGDFVTADDFIFPVKRAISSRLGCTFVEMFFPIKNAKKFYEHKIRDFGKVGISAIDKHTLRIELEKPCSSFMYLIMQPCWYPLNKMVCESLESFGDWSNDFGDICVSNGPFVVAKCKQDKNIVLEKNPYYWDYENIKLDGVKWIFGDNESEILKMFQEDVIDVVPHSVIDSMSYDHQFGDLKNLVPEKETKSTLCFGCCYLAFNITNSPLNNRDVRTALAISINREKLLPLLPNIAVCAAYRLIPSSLEGYSNESLFKEDVECAKDLLKKAGYAENFPKLTILSNDRSQCKVIVEFLKQEWKENLGIDVEIKYCPWDKFLHFRKRGQFDMVLSDWFGDYPDPMTFLGLFSELSQQNYCRWSNEEYNKLLDLAMSSHNLAVRSQILERAEGVLIDDMPIMPLYFEYNTYLIKRRVIGWDVNL
ncbi:MAG: peptide ABC transporter substrate-binding protein, partial [Opitutales bacterium]|nr:peptide ABC transporter substrate-binding protein [Opitutales bacterium]